MDVHALWRVLQMLIGDVVVDKLAVDYEIVVVAAPAAVASPVACHRAVKVWVMAAPLVVAAVAVFAAICLWDLQKSFVSAWFLKQCVD